MIENIEDIYPLTIISDRYDGCYTGGIYLACNLYPEIVAELELDDEDYWKDPTNRSQIGFGNTISGALTNLISKMNK